MHKACCRHDFQSVTGNVVSHPQRLISIGHTAFVSPWSDSNIHRHNVSEEYYLLFSGQLNLVMENFCITLQPNEILMVRPNVPHAVCSGTGKIEYFGIRTPALDDKQVVSELKTDVPLLYDNERLVSGDWGHRIPLDMPQHKNCWLFGAGSALYKSQHFVMAYLDFPTYETANAGIGALYAPELSPDGQRIVFANHGNGLWVMDADGENPRAISFRDDIDPTWSPDGSMIAFASSRSGKRQLYVMNANGKNVRQVTDLNNMGGRSTWSPDGTKLAFYRGVPGDHDIYTINIDGTRLDRLTNGGDSLGPSWSPDGEWIAFTSFRDGNNEIYIVHPDGRGETRLTNSPVSDWQPRWGR